MKKVLILGSGGAGKTTFARAMAARTGLPLFHLDSLYWRPGWQATPDEAWRAQVQELVQRDAWIIDGSYTGTLSLRVPEADTIVVLDLPAYRCLWNIVKRRLRYAAWTGRRRPGMPEGCPERIFFSFVKWVLTYRRRVRPKVLARIEMLRRPATEVHIFTSYRQLEKYLAEIPPRHAD